MTVPNQPGTPGSVQTPNTNPQAGNPTQTTTGGLNPLTNPPVTTPTTPSKEEQKKPTAKFTKPDVDGAKVNNPIKVEGETSGKIVQIRACGHNLHAGAKVENGKFEAIMPTFPTGPFQLEAWVDGEMVAATKVDVQS